MHATDVMTTNVITVAPDTSIQDLATLLGNHGISGVPVVDAANNLVGIVSEGDLLHRAETGTERRTERRRVRWLDSFLGDRDLARDYVKSHSRTVRDVMTRDVITVTETTGLDEIANLLETEGIKRVPVVRDGKVIGIVSRANLVRALVATKTQPATSTDIDDRTIRNTLLAELQGQPWARVWAADVIVRDKVVHLWCSDDRSEEERRALRIAAENTPGVRGVEEHIVVVPMIPSL
ncbi:MAG: CBS domain-containing protein [Rhodopila sp.]|nr:CBS domain-containing protein [Rhodopila sp.]